MLECHGRPKFIEAVQLVSVAVSDAAAWPMLRGRDFTGPGRYFTISSRCRCGRLPRRKQLSTARWHFLCRRIVCAHFCYAILMMRPELVGIKGDGKLPISTSSGRSAAATISCFPKSIEPPALPGSSDTSTSTRIRPRPSHQRFCLGCVASS